LDDVVVVVTEVEEPTGVVMVVVVELGLRAWRLSA
jgi:hypothetical protein